VANTPAYVFYPRAPFLSHAPRVTFRTSGKACASWAMWKVRTSRIVSEAEQVDVAERLQARVAGFESPRHVLQAREHNPTS
jgi:hypothetical protein